MRKLDRYIGKTVALSMLMVLFVLMGLDLIFSFIAETEELEGDYQLMEALIYVLTTLPRRIYEIIPLVSLIGCLAGLGILASGSELVVMRAAGVSIVRIVWSVMKPTLFVITVGLLLGQYLAPFTEQVAQSQKAKQQGVGLGNSKGHWHRDGDTYMHLNAVEPGGVLFGITRYEFDDEHKLVQASQAKRAIFQGDHWVLEDVVVTDIGDGGTRSFRFKTQRWNTEQLDPDLLKFVVSDPDDLAITDLYGYARYLAEQGVSSGSYLLAFWKKATQPLATAVLVWVAIAFIFGPLRTQTMGFRIFMGVIVGLVFKYVQDLLGPASLVFGFQPAYASIIPIIICFVVGSIFVKRAG